jgi:mannose-6-phosphate isomerase-like protein (cupin superfamily)
MASLFSYNSSIFAQQNSYMEPKQNLSDTLATETSGKEALIWLGELAILHTTGKETGGRYSMVELYATKEGEAPWHVHHREDEGFYIIEGEMTIYIGDKVVKARAGDFILAPKDVPHMYTVDSPKYARILMTFSPSGFEDFVRATSVPATSLTPPEPETVNINYEEVMKLAGQFGAEFVDPPPGASNMDKR